MTRILIIILTLFYAALQAAGQKDLSLRIRVTDSARSFALKGVTAFNGRTEQSTDSNGMATFRCRPGNVELTLSRNGYAAMKFSLILGADTCIELRMKERIVALKGFSVGSKGPVMQRAGISQTAPGRTELSAAEIRKVPAIGGEADPVKVLQLTPGVKRGTEGGTGMFVRGGSADQNMVLLDDAPVYNAGHVLGFFSVFNPLSVKDASVYKSSFPASYGGRLSSVLDVRTREGSMKKYGAEFSAGTIAASAMVNGPIIRNRLSFAAAARRSYIDKTFRLAGLELPVSFWDVNMKLTYRHDKRNKITLSTYGGKDLMRWSGKLKHKDTAGKYSALNRMPLRSDSEMGNLTASLKWLHSNGPGKLSHSTVLTVSDYRYRIEGVYPGGSTSVGSGISEGSVRWTADRMIGKHANLFFGASAILRNFRSREVRSKENSTSAETNQYTPAARQGEHAAFIRTESKLTAKLKTEAGLRVSYAGQGYLPYPEPRVSLTYRADSLVNIGVSYSGMRQYIHQVSGSSVVLPTDIWYPATGGLKPSDSRQLNIVVSGSTGKKHIFWQAELYYKSFENLTEYKEGTSPLFSSVADVVSGRGNAYGSEFFVRAETGRLSGWAGYTLSWSDRQFDSLNGGKRYFSKYDRRHDVSVVGSYKISKRFQLAFSWVFSSGSPFTAITSQYLSLSPGMDKIQTLPVYGSRNAFRFSASHRLDLDLSYRVKGKGKTNHEFHLSIYNAYNRTQPDRVESVRNSDGSYSFRQKGLFGLIPALSYQISI